MHTPVHTLALGSVTYRLHDRSGDDLGLLEHPAPNFEPGDVIVLVDGREAVVTSWVARPTLVP